MPCGGKRDLDLLIVLQEKSFSFVLVEEDEGEPDSSVIIEPKDFRHSGSSRERSQTFSFPPSLSSVSASYFSPDSRSRTTAFATSVMNSSQRRRDRTATRAPHTHTRPRTKKKFYNKPGRGYVLFLRSTCLHSHL